MWRKIEQVHPTLAESGKFIDWQQYRLGRLQSEMRTEYKKSALDSELVTVANIRVNPKKADSK